MRHMRTAPAFMITAYEPDKDWSWTFGGFAFARSSFYPEGWRTPDAVANLGGSAQDDASERQFFDCWFNFYFN